MAAIICDVQASKPEKRKHKKIRRMPGTKIESLPVDLTHADGDDLFKMMEADDEFDNLKKSDEFAEEIPPEDDLVPKILNPCGNVHCSAGRVCEVDDLGEAECVCIKSCPVETESRRKVCTNHNETWTSDCSVYQQRCWCDRADERCKGDEYKHIHIEYYGECKDMPSCRKEEMADFPRRMRDWLFNIMRDLADRKELPEHYLQMEREAETNMTRRWTNAAIWKWCDLDGHPHDRSVSRHELFPIKAPLMALEHCIAPFFDQCDTDNNHRITLTEWATCLELDETDIEERCDRLEDNMNEIDAV